MKKAEKAKGNQHTARSRDTTKHPTLADQGITKDQSADWQKMGEIPDDEFEEALAGPGRAVRVSRDRRGRDRRWQGWRVGDDALNWPS